MNVKELQAKLQDYKRFAIILTAASVFLYIGVVFQHAGKNSLQLFTMMGTTALLLVFAIFFIFRVSKIKKQLQEQEDK
ncbi:YrhC family protein [Sutcliffiella rhizosphaerae]|uniref:YrhC-like protein n=1 Tax=Sutcliffiella rhizosphaerae TaxID=2880967 RepID=A0ABM8YHN5_9BACI|nr:YrhC family protein [Sutcliffiella rhizosphaerae]CAG9619406.1 hypothetical protein BACCIP111883_00173 [Sutcliffiella rhizosphaerae]